MQYILIKTSDLSTLKYKNHVTAKSLNIKSYKIILQRTENDKKKTISKKLSTRINASEYIL
jgi:hypothetical protein